MSSKLFTPLKIKSIEIKNRIWVSPMCQYSSVDGHPTDWHFVHLGSRAVGGAGLVMVEATAVSPEGRISPDDSGIWSDAHIPGFKRITDFMHEQGSVSAIQIAHAGRKASTSAPWKGHDLVSPTDGGWQSLGPSAIPFNSDDPPPKEMTDVDLKKVMADFISATERSLKAGFQVLEVHMAHGYLLHEFLSPISNQRKDNYGESLENRMRFPLEVAKAVREKWPKDLPLFARISATDWSEDSNSWNLNDSVTFTKKLKELGYDLIDCSSGGSIPNPKIKLEPGYQVPFSDRVRKDSKILTAAVGLITEAKHAESILLEEKADAIFMAREFLRDPYWPMHAAKELDVKIKKPNQYGRS